MPLSETYAANSDDTAWFLGVCKLFSKSEPETTFTSKYVQSVVGNAPVDVLVADITGERRFFRRWVGDVSDGISPNDVMRTYLQVMCT